MKFYLTFPNVNNLFLFGSMFKKKRLSAKFILIVEVIFNVYQTFKK